MGIPRNRAAGDRVDRQLPALHPVRLQHLSDQLALTRSDGELLRRAAGGDASAFEAVVSRHQDAVFRYLRVMAGNDADAEDALQETFLAAWQAAGSFRGGDSARGWLLTIARHGLGRLRRLRVDEPARLIPLDNLGCEAGWGEAGGVPLPEDGKERRARLETALASLGQEDREIIVLRDLEGFSGEETAELLALGLAAMKTRLHRARLRLMATLRREHG